MSAAWDQLTARHPARHAGLRIFGVTVAACLTWALLIFGIAALLWGHTLPPIWFVFLATWGGANVGLVAMWAAYLRWSP